MRKFISYLIVMILLQFLFVNSSFARATEVMLLMDNSSEYLMKANLDELIKNLPTNLPIGYSSIVEEGCDGVKIEKSIKKVGLHDFEEVDFTVKNGKQNVFGNLAMSKKEFNDGAKKIIIMVVDGFNSCMSKDDLYVYSEELVEEFNLGEGYLIDVGEKNTEWQEYADLLGFNYYFLWNEEIENSLKRILQRETQYYGNILNGGDDFTNAQDVTIGEYQLNENIRAGEKQFYSFDLRGGEELEVELKIPENIEFRGQFKLYDQTEEKVVEKRILNADIKQEKIYWLQGHFIEDKDNKYFICLEATDFEDIRKGVVLDIKINDKYDANASRDAGETFVSAMTIDPGEYEINWLGKNDFGNDETDFYKIFIQPLSEVELHLIPAETDQMFLTIYDEDQIEKERLFGKNQGEVLKYVLKNEQDEREEIYYLEVTNLKKSYKPYKLNYISSYYEPEEIVEEVVEKELVIVEEVRVNNYWEWGLFGGVVFLILVVVIVLLWLRARMNDK